jgi:hypothetical protein
LGLIYGEFANGIESGLVLPPQRVNELWQNAGVPCEEQRVREGSGGRKKGDNGSG